MTELSGFNPVSKLAPEVLPQSLRIPTNRDGAIAKAAEILGAMWDAVDAGLSPNIKVEVLRYNPTAGEPVTMCRITPTQPDGVASSVANPGDWLTADSSGVRGMTNDKYAGMFTQDLPLEWAALEAPPAASIDDDGKVTLTFPAPTSANRPFAYVVARDGEAVATPAPITVAGQVALPLDLVLAEDETATLAVEVTATKYGTTATSAPVTVTRVPPAAS